MSNNCAGGDLSLGPVTGIRTYRGRAAVNTGTAVPRLDISILADKAYRIGCNLDYSIHEIPILSVLWQ